MFRTQIQLPAELHLRAKQLAEAKEIPLAELARRGLELLLDQYPLEQVRKPWRPPIVDGLGWKGLSHEQIKAAAQQSALEDELEEQAERDARV